MLQDSFHTSLIFIVVGGVTGDGGGGGIGITNSCGITITSGGRVTLIITADGGGVTLIITGGGGFAAAPGACRCLPCLSGR